MVELSAAVLSTKCSKTYVLTGGTETNALSAPRLPSAWVNMNYKKTAVPTVVSPILWLKRVKTVEINRKLYSGKFINLLNDKYYRDYTRNVVYVQHLGFVFHQMPPISLYTVMHANVAVHF